MSRGLIRAALLAALVALPIGAQAPGRAVARCRLAYPYNARDGALTCRGWDYAYRTYYAAPEARRARRLPAGVRLVLEYEDGPGCGEGCWTRIFRVDAP